MGIFSEISQIKTLRAARTDGAVSGDTEKTGVKPWVKGGFVLICLLATTSLVLMRLFDGGDTPSRWAYSVGIESFSIIVSVII